MAHSIVDSDAVQGETFLPGQIFVLGGFVLRANSLGHLEQIDSYAPGHQVRFGNLNYMADIRGDLIFDGFERIPDASRSHDEQDVTLSSDSVRRSHPQLLRPSIRSKSRHPRAEGWTPPWRLHSQWR